MSAREWAIEVRPEGLYLPAIELFLDPALPVARAFVSHAHGDHASGGAGEVFASPETLALIAARRGESSASTPAPIAWDGAVELKTPSGATARLSLAPAGHILGAAQLVIDHAGGRFVYGGDYRSGGDATHAIGAPVPCDELVLEATYGLPIFRFPSRDLLLTQIVAWCGERIDAGETPVLLAYALGKSQALAHACLAAGLPVRAHGAVRKMCAAYEALGVSLGVADGTLQHYASLDARAKKEPGVLLTPPWTANHPMIRKLKSARVALVSGHACIDAALDQRRADAGFALSDHADYDDLIATARATGARRVYVTHGEELGLFARLLGAAISAEVVPLVAAKLVESVTVAGEEA